MSFLNKKNKQHFASKTIVIIMIITFSSYANAQINSKHTDTIKTTTQVKKDNLLDMQTNILSSVFGEDLDGKSNKKPIGFLELLDKIDLTPEQKQEYRNLYYLQAKDMTKKTKDSLSNALSKKILEAKNN